MPQMRRRVGCASRREARALRSSCWAEAAGCLYAACSTPATTPSACTGREIGQSLYLSFFFLLSFSFSLCLSHIHTHGSNIIHCSVCFALFSFFIRVHFIIDYRCMKTGNTRSWTLEILTTMIIKKREKERQDLHGSLTSVAS